MSSVDFYRRVPKDLTEVRHEFTNERGSSGDERLCHTHTRAKKAKILPILPQQQRRT